MPHPKSSTRSLPSRGRRSANAWYTDLPQSKNASLVRNISKRVGSYFITHHLTIKKSAVFQAHHYHIDRTCHTADMNLKSTLSRGNGNPEGAALFPVEA